MTQTDHTKPLGHFKIPDNWADMTEAEKDDWSRSVAADIAHTAAGEPPAR